METFKKIIISILFIFLTSCFSTVPPVKFEGYTPSKGQYDIKAALIIPKEFKSYVYYFTIVGSCMDRQDRAKLEFTIQQGQTHAKSDVGIAAEELLIKGLPCIFKKVDIYGDILEIKDKASYDYIITPAIKADMTYDSDKARRRKKQRVGLGSVILTNIEFIENLEINAIIELGLEVKDVQTNVIIKNFSSKFTYIGSIAGGDCSRRYDHYDSLVGNSSSRLFGAAIGAAFSNMLKRIDEHMEPIIQAKAQERALPSSLSLAIRFSDDSSFLPNKILDAGEQAEVFVTVKNDGKGTGYGTVLKVTSENPMVTVDKEIPLGDIPPGGTKEVKVNVKASLDIQDGTIPFSITCNEKRGYDSKKYTLNVQAAHYEKPELVITGYRINDGSTGLAQGNGNGIPENGETIEVIPLVKNTGTGTAYKVDLSLQSLSGSLEVKHGSATIPQILPGQVGTANLAFAIPTTYSGRSVEFTLAATDIRGESGTNKQFALATEINQPSLAYVYRVIDQKGNNRNDIQNGEYGEIEIRPVNKGKMEARNISIDLASDVVSFSKAHDEILRIGPQAEYAPIRFSFQVPRVTDQKSANITVKLSQKDFPGISDTINIPIRLVRPEFRILHQLLVQNRNGIIEQGETGELLVQVENIGHLEANNVVLGMTVLEKGVLINAPKEVNLGKIEAGKLSEYKRFPIHVQRSVSPGELPIHFTIAEQHFGRKSITLALNIAKEQAEVITVKGQERPKKPVDIAQYNIPPTIAIATPYDNERVASETVVLKGVVSDDKAVAQIEIKVNGRSLEERGIKVSAQVKVDPKEREIFENVALQPGKNIIMVTAYDNEHLSTSKTITVYRESKKGVIWAAVIGINKYKDPKLNLKYARNDAEAFATYLRSNMGMESDHILELYDEKATLRNIKSLLGTQLRQRANKPEDSIFVFFAGHGAPEQSALAKDEDKIRKYILPHDSEVEDLYATALLMDEIANLFGDISAERIIFIIDSCYSGAGGGRTIWAPRGRAILSEDFLNRLSQGKGRIILTSSKPGELSEESDDLKHGYFTYYLLEGLKGKADINGDGIIDIDEISLYLNNTVPEKTKGKQHPVKKGEAEGQVVVGRVR